jgi:hypothetical protein
LEGQSQYLEDFCRRVSSVQLKAWLAGTDGGSVRLVSLVSALLTQCGFPDVDEVAVPGEEEAVEVDVERVVYMGSAALLVHGGVRVAEEPHARYEIIPTVAYPRVGSRVVDWQFVG